MRRRYVLFIEVETREAWQEPDYYLHLALKTMREMAERLGNLEISYYHAFEVKDRGLYSLLYELMSKIVYGKKIKKRTPRHRG